jgi:uncharacterized protein YprB with RNaseH-like and TPR domain
VHHNETLLKLSDEIRARLWQLHRSGAAAPTMPSTEVRRSSPSDDWLTWGRQVENASGKHFRLRRPLAEYWPRAEAAVARMTTPAAGSLGARLGRQSHHELAALAEHFPASTLFLDLETCGFAGSSVFLVGLIWQADGALVLDQLLARDYGEERAVLETLWQSVERNRVLVTFNGKSFDWPMVRDRSTRHRLEKSRHNGSRGRPLFPADLVHCDLLHHARRRWRRLLPNCKLQTLERYVCNRRRRDDLPGDQVPWAYHEFVRSGRRDKMGAILHHNGLDLVTLVEIAIRLAST